MQLEPSEEEIRLLSPEELASLRKGYADFEASAGKPKDPLGMPQEKTDFPIGIYDDDEATPFSYDENG